MPGMDHGPGELEAVRGDEGTAEEARPAQSLLAGYAEMRGNDGKCRGTRCISSGQRRGAGAP